MSDEDLRFFTFCTNLTAAAKSLDCHEWLAIVTGYISEPLDSESLIYRLPMDPDILNEHFLAISMLDTIFIPESRQFALHQGGERDFTLAGPREFIEQTLGCDIKIANSKTKVCRSTLRKS